MTKFESGKYSKVSNQGIALDYDIKEFCPQMICSSASHKGEQPTDNVIGESENKYQNEAKGILSERRHCMKMRLKVLSLFHDSFRIPYWLQ